MATETPTLRASADERATVTLEADSVFMWKARIRQSRARAGCLGRALCGLPRTQTRRERARIYGFPSDYGSTVVGITNSSGRTLRKKGQNRGICRTLVRFARNYLERVALVDAFDR